ncbi:hypothetical protein PC113_g22407 [Phytophthora cactorum]|uniref:DDE-1 domain-containing protein n=3 Tax=Phytophthora cactorum TaxID=29920 RepID=A0A8T0Y5L0_9STRA|nr:hypothetical protein PC113_g22407 [Phytophthora cactorum]
MKKRPKNKNKTKLKGAEAYKSAPVVQVTTQLGVHRSSVYRWRKHAKALEANKKAGNKYYVRTSAHDALRVRYPVLEKQLLDYVAEIRKNRKLCVTTKCLILMMAKFDPAFVRARQYTALCSWTGRFLKRNHLVEVADSFVNSVNVTVEMDGILSFHKSFEPKYSGLFNMDQTAIFVDNPSKLTIDYRGTTNSDTIQGSSENTGRCSVFLCGSATGEKLPPFVVFAGVPGCRVADSVTAPTFRSPAVEHIVQAKAWCDHSIMKEWIEKI